MSTPKPSIADLLKWAKDKKPDAPSKSKWVDFAPVVDELVANDFSVYGAIRELVAKGAIHASKSRTAYHAILQHRARQSK